MRKIPEAIRDKFLEKGIKIESALTVFKTDSTNDRVPCDAYSVVTEEGIATLFCLMALRKRRSAFFARRKAPEPVLEVLDFSFTPLDKIRSIVCEELITGIRLVARCDGEDRVLLYATNHCSKALFSFCDDFAAYRETGAYPEQKEEKVSRCPRCGKPYPFDQVNDGEGVPGPGVLPPVQSQRGAYVQAHALLKAVLAPDLFCFADGADHCGYGRPDAIPLRQGTV